METNAESDIRKSYLLPNQGERSVNKFRKSQICKFADLCFFRFVDLPQM